MSSFKFVNSDVNMLLVLSVLSSAGTRLSFPGPHWSDGIDCGYLD